MIVTDNGNTASDPVTKSIQVTNVATSGLVIEGAPTGLALEGTAIVLTTSQIEPGSADTLIHNWTVTRDGLPYGTAQSGHPFNFLPTDNGSYVITVSVRDDDSAVGAAVSTSVTIQVNNAPPVVTPVVTPADVINEGSSLTFSLATTTDPSSNDTAAGFRYDYDLNGDGVYEILGSTSANQLASYPVSGNYILRGRAIDKDGGTTEVSRSITVANVAPVVTLLTLPSSAAQGTLVPLSGTFVDPGTDSWRGSAEIQRSGSSDVLVLPVTLNANKTFNMSHVFGAAGTYSVKVSVTDFEAGTSVSQTANIQIANVAPQFDVDSSLEVVAGHVTTSNWSVHRSWRRSLDLNR